MSDRQDVTFTVNGEERMIRVEPRRSLADALREDCGLTGTHLGCEHGVCGACTVLVDDQPVRSCLMFAVQAEGTRVRTVEGLASWRQIAPAATGVLGPSRVAMRLLHAGIFDAGRRHPGA